MCSFFHQNYFEELVSVRDNQLTRLQSELQTLTTESETQRRDLEGVILELQSQVWVNLPPPPYVACECTLCTDPHFSRTYENTSISKWMASNTLRHLWCLQKKEQLVFWPICWVTDRYQCEFSYHVLSIFPCFVLSCLFVMIILLFKFL